METNFRDKDGVPLEVDNPINTWEDNVGNLEGFKGKGHDFWFDGGHHTIGRPLCHDIAYDVEFDAVDLYDGTVYKNGLMDVIYFSYDVEAPPNQISIHELADLIRESDLFTINRNLPSHHHVSDEHKVAIAIRCSDHHGSPSYEIYENDVRTITAFDSEVHVRLKTGRPIVFTFYDEVTIGD
jgi:hypothetical protein